MNYIIRPRGHWDLTKEHFAYDKYKVASVTAFQSTLMKERPKVR